MPGAGDERADPTRFIGRESVLGDIARTFGEGHRLITLTGIGGMGKTRLAREYSARATRPCRFFDLTEARSAADLHTVASRVLELPMTSGTEAAEVLSRAVSGLGAVLLVFDDFDRLVSDASPLLARLVASARRAQFLVTSRERLRLAGERVLTVPPLSVTEGGELFLDRARAVRRDLAGGDRGTVDALVRAVDGIPLAIELCAARVDVMEPSQLLAGLSKRFELLTVSPRNARSRHATLRAAIDWSWELLDGTQRAALSSLAVFRGGCSADAAARVMDTGARSPLGVVQELLEKSLVNAWTAGHERRFGLYDSVRAYALEKCAPAELEAVRARHAAWFLDAAGKWRSAPDSSRLLLEADNMMAVHERAVAMGDVRAALEALLALEWPFRLRGPMARFVELLDQTLALPRGPDVQAALIARAIFARGSLRAPCGQVSEGLADMEQAAQMAESTEHGAATAAVAHSRLASFYMVLERREEGRLHYREAVKWISRVEDTARADCFLYLVDHLWRDDDRAAWRAAVDEALALYRALGRRREEGYALENVAARYIEDGALAEARGEYEAALTAAREVSDRRLEGVVTRGLNAVLQETGELDAAATGCEQVIRLARESGDLFLEGLATQDLGQTRHEQGRVREAREILRRAVSLHARSGVPRNVHLASASLASALAESGQLDEAEARLVRAEQGMRGEGQEEDLHVAELHRGVLQVALARESASRGAVEEARRLIERARAVATSVTLATEEGRYGKRLLLRALDSATARSPDWAGSSEALHVSVDLAWFRMPAGPRVDLSRRPVLRRLLDALVRGRIHRPGVAVTTQELIKSGWPDEKMLRRAAMARLKVAVHTLRKLGVGATLIGTRGGYLLDANIPVRRIEPEPTVG